MKMPGKLVPVEILGPVRRLPRAEPVETENSFEDLGPAPLQAPPLPLHDVHSASEKGMVQPKARYRSCFSAAENDPSLVFYRLILKCIHSRNTQGLPSDTKKTKTKKTQTVHAMVASAWVAVDRDGAHHSKRGRD